MREDGSEACIEVLGFYEKGLVSLVTAGEKAENVHPVQTGRVCRCSSRQVGLPFSGSVFSVRAWAGYS